MTKGQCRRIPMVHWERLLKSCGLRRAELEHLRVGDITQDEEGHIWLHIAQSDESPARDVPVVRGFDWAITDILAQRFPPTFHDVVSFHEAMSGRAPDELLVASVPPKLDIEQGRRDYAWWLYFTIIGSLGDVEYPQTFHKVGEQVRLALGLPEVDATIRHCMRRAKRGFLLRELEASM